MKKALFTIIIFLPLLSFCQRSVFYESEELKTKTVLVLAPVSEVFVIKYGNNLEKDSGYSKTAYRNMASHMQQSFPKYVNKLYFKSDSITRTILIKCVINANKEITSKKEAAKYHLPDSVVKLFDTSAYNYVFCTYNGGFIRDRNNLVNKRLGNDVFDFLTGFGTKPWESATTVTGFIIDLKQKAIVFFERRQKVNENPLETKGITKLMNEIISSAFPKENKNP